MIKKKELEAAPEEVAAPVEEVKTEVVETEVEISPEVEQKLEETIEKMVSSKVEKALEANEAIKKSVDFSSIKVSPIDEKVLMAKQLVAVVKGNYNELSKLNRAAVDTYRGKIAHPYMNEENSTEGGALVPPADFVAEVSRLDNIYGVAFRDARVRNVSSNAITLNKKTGSLTLTKTGEAVAKTGTKMTFGQDTITLAKYAGIAPFSEELDMDSAVNLQQELARDFALARAQTADQLVFTDATSGLFENTSTYAYSWGAALTDLDFTDLSNAMALLSQTAKIGAKWYISRGVESQLRNVTVGTNYAWGPASQGTPGTIWGYQYEVVDVITQVTTASNTTFGVFGNLQNVTLAVKGGMEMKLLTEATVSDTSSGTIDLASQDMVALRGVTRMAAKCQFPEGFVLIGTGSVS
jgi:HK97 family phage major capsid protein